MAPLSVIDPIPVALQRTRRILFQPFLLNKWLRLGFCAFLMGSAPAGLFSGGNPGSNHDGGTGGLDPEALLLWIQEHQTLLLALGLVAVLGITLLVLLFTWLSSRGRFMLLDGLIHNRGAIVEPWHRLRREANSLFRFRVGLGLISIALLALILAGATALCLADLQAGVVSLRTVMALLIGLPLLLVWLLALQVISMLLLDFVAPVMLLRRLPVGRAWPIVIDGLVRAQPGGFALYLLARLLLDGAIGTLSILVVLLSCCLALVPYIGAVLLLPLTVFQLCYTLAYLEQKGSDWQIFPVERAAAPGG